jgi:hypothetical protein
MKDYILKVAVYHTPGGVHLIRGFLVTDINETFGLTHQDKYASWCGSRQDLLNILGDVDFDVDVAINFSQRKFRLDSGKNLLKMRKQTSENEVDKFLAEVDDFIKISILLIVS